jgi:hypothetical protein
MVTTAKFIAPLVNTYRKRLLQLLRNYSSFKTECFNLGTHNVMFHFRLEFILPELNQYLAINTSTFQY